MIYGIYCIRDVKTSFLVPTVDLNDNSAIRNFAHACMRNDSLFFTHPADYSLYKVGEFENDTGVITSFDVPVHLIDAVNVVEGE